MSVTWIFILLPLMGMAQGQLSLQDASEGPCNPSINKFLASVDAVFAGIPRNFSVPIGSQAMYRHYGEVFLGRPLVNEAELAEMQPKIWYALTESTKNFGFPKRESPAFFTQLCHAHHSPESSEDSGGQVDCKSLDGSPSTNVNAPSGNTMDSVVWTDNKSTYLIVRCPKDNIQDYKVLSTNKTITEPAKTVILNRIKELGFDLKNIYFMNYDD